MPPHFGACTELCQRQHLPPIKQSAQQMPGIQLTQHLRNQSGRIQRDPEPPAQTSRLRRAGRMRQRAGQAGRQSQGFRRDAHARPGAPRGTARCTASAKSAGQTAGAVSGALLCGNVAGRRCCDARNSSPHRRTRSRQRRRAAATLRRATRAGPAAAPARQVPRRSTALARAAKTASGRAAGVARGSHPLSSVSGPALRRHRAHWQKPPSRAPKEGPPPVSSCA